MDIRGLQKVSLIDYPGRKLKCGAELSATTGPCKTRIGVKEKNLKKERLS